MIPIKPNMVVPCVLSVLISTAVDLGLSAMGGYTLRSDSATLAALDAGFLGLFAVPAVLILHYATGRTSMGSIVQRAPWFTLLVAALVPIDLVRLWRDHDLVSLLMQAPLVFALGAVAFFEIRKPAMPLNLRVAGVVALICVAAVIGAVVLPTPGSSHLRPPETGAVAASAERPNILVITLDTLRADHVGAYGYGRPTTPWLDEFAKKSTLFERAMSTSSYTLPSHASLFTGLYPEAHGADVSQEHGAISLKELGIQPDRAPVKPLSPEAVTLAEILMNEGYDTGAICANSAYLYRGFGLDQGFNTYVDQRGAVESWRPAGLTIADKLFGGRFGLFDRIRQCNEKHYLLASEVNALAFRWLKKRQDRPFFLFLNYMDCHTPYIPVGEYRGLFPASFEGGIIDNGPIRRGEREILPRERDILVDPYDSGIRNDDDALKELFNELKRWGLEDETLVVIVSDHGESFGEHRAFEHHNGVYQTEIHIPLIVRLPGQTQGRRETRLVSIADVMPTVLDKLGIESPTNAHGESLFKEGRALPIVAYLGPYEREFSEHAIYRDAWKLIRRSNGSLELYNLQEDGDELRNLAGERKDLVEALGRDFDQFHAAIRPLFKTSSESVDPEALHRLRGLGYLK